MFNLVLIFTFLLWWIHIYCSGESVFGCFNPAYNVWQMYSWQNKSLTAVFNVSCSTGVIHLKSVVHSIPKWTQCPQECVIYDQTCDCCGRIPTNDLCQSVLPIEDVERLTCDRKKICSLQLGALDMNIFCNNSINYDCRFLDPTTRQKRCLGRQVELKYDCLSDTTGERFPASTTIVQTHAKGSQEPEPRSTVVDQRPIDDTFATASTKSSEQSTVNGVVTTTDMQEAQAKRKYDSEEEKDRVKTNGVIIGLSVALAFLVILCVVVTVCGCIKHRRMEAKFKREINAGQLQMDDESRDMLNRVSSAERKTSGQGVRAKSSHRDANEVSQASDVENGAYQNTSDDDQDAAPVYTEVAKHLKKKSKSLGKDRSNQWTEPRRNGIEADRDVAKTGGANSQYELAQPLIDVKSNIEEGESTEMVENPYYDGLA